MSIGVVAVAVILLLVATVLAAVAEAVVTHLGVARAASLHDQGERRADALLWVLDRREAALAVAVLARVVAIVGVVGIVVLRANEEGVSGRGWIAVAGAIVVTLAAVEVLARTVAVARADQTALRLAPLLRATLRLPLVARLAALPGRLVRRPSSDGAVEDQPPVSEEELLAFAEVAAEAEVIEVEERALIRSIIEFGDTIVREVMVPRPDMITVSGSWLVGDVMEVVILNGYSRIPVVGDGIDDIVGIVYAKDLMRAERDARSGETVELHVRPARFVPEQKRVAELLPEMQAEQYHMAVVIDEYGGVAGLVTLEDLIEELVGEIVDEFDVEDPMVEPLADGAYRVNARMPLDEVNELLDADLPTGDWDTIGGLLFGLFGRVPQPGEAVEIDGHRLTAVRVQGRRIGMVRVDRIPAAEPLDDESVAS